MAGKKNSRTSKTDHVLSLLSGGSVEAQPEAKERRKQPAKDAPASESSTPEKAPVQAEHRAAPPILEVARVHNEALSEAIREALSDTLEQELAREAAQAADAPAAVESAAAQETAVQSAPESGTPEEKAVEDTPAEIRAEAEAPGQGEAQEMPVPQSEAAKSAPTAQDAPASVSSGEDAPAASEPEPAGTAEKEAEQKPEQPSEAEASFAKPAESALQASAAMEAEPEKEMSEAAPEAQAEPAQQPKGDENTPGETAPLWPAARTPLSDGSVYIDVMAELVDEPIEKYVRLFGLCSCRRCLADVRALTLSRLTPKYVVLPGPAVTPMMSFFQAKFESAVIAQVINACKTVMESPRHTL